MSDGHLTAIPEQYAQAAGRNIAPPLIPSDPLVAGASPIEALMRVLGLAANAGDSSDYDGSLEEYAARDLHTSDAAEGFAGQDHNAAAQMQATTQLIPQLAAGIAGALGGVLQPLAQLPQQLSQGLTQGLTQAVQAGALRQSDSAAAGFDDLGEMDDADGSHTGSDGDALGEPFGTAAVGANGGANSAEAGRPGTTVPTAPLGPPAVPSPSTSPAAASPAITRGAGNGRSADDAAGRSDGAYHRRPGAGADPAGLSACDPQRRRGTGPPERRGAGGRGPRQRAGGRPPHTLTRLRPAAGRCVPASSDRAAED